MIRRIALMGTLVLVAHTSTVAADEPIRPAMERFADEGATEVPDFQRHVLTLMGRMGCNTRSCHGSFQGQGGFRLSLFGYDFKLDRETLLKDGSDRVTLDDPEGSKILQKPTLAIPHKGGKRLEAESWQYRVLTRWIEGGAKGVDAKAPTFDRLEVTPGEISFREPGQKDALRVVAHWSDGSSEDVTCLARFRTNDESIAEISEEGVITSVGPGDTHVVAFYDNGVAPVPVLRAVSDLAGESYPSVPTPTEVDELVVAKLRKLGIVPSPTCTDAEFLRRVGLDLAGTLPTPDEVEAFLSDPAPDKRARKVDDLLSRPSYAAWWTTKLCDYTGAAPKVLNVQQVGPQAPRQWYDWIYKRVLENTPYDEIAAGLVLATSRPKGESYDDFVKAMASYAKPGESSKFADRETMPHFWARQNFRKPEERVIGFSYSFLGVRLECAQCHKHPFDQWTQDDFNRFGAFFNAVGFGVSPEARPSFQRINKDTGLDKLKGGDRNRKLQQLRRDGEISPWQEVFVNRNGMTARVAGLKKDQAPKTRRVVSAKVLGGEEVALDGSDDPRAPLMEWLRSKDNPYFARAFVNRVWANYFGRGIVESPDDMNLANPPSNEALLAYLADGFVDHDFDMKWLHREITGSLAYQRSWQSNETNRLDEKNFSRALIRRIPAEVLIDAVAMATGSSRIQAKAATDISTRATGPGAGGPARRNQGTYASKVFGASTRETNCDCNRSDEPNLLQSIYLQNDAELYAAIDRADGWVAEKAKTSPRNVVDDTKKEAPDQGSGLMALSLPELETRLKRIKAAGAPNPRIMRIQDRISELKRESQASNNERSIRKKVVAGKMPEGRPTSTAPRFSPADRESIVREAYLRTLSRRPLEAEAKAAIRYLTDSDGSDGMRDLLWALLNTKEFITNH
ncbi:DUF1549 and DUF1553 domain-containing protein [Tundrisphaera lichenicola]|uniref:DUF1549 and DUF1553 domain-containing protein n=1 Tax=Tundrisphaera lichenicola TaxID=2029860 RepID=UPI003EB703AB